MRRLVDATHLFQSKLERAAGLLGFYASSCRHAAEVREGGDEVEVHPYGFSFDLFRETMFLP